ncbi:MAG TPA: hypothetical protein VFG29_04415 [Syntrophales bacterium]|nr:hypothetical protein [Syntrophales bacterium]
MKTLNFDNSGHDRNAIAVSCSAPIWYFGRRFLPLAPARNIIKINDESLYRKLYREAAAFFEQENNLSGDKKHGEN